VLDAVGWEPAGFDDLAERTALTVGALALVVEALVDQGLLRRERGFLLRLTPRPSNPEPSRPARPSNAERPPDPGRPSP
jgi:DNA-binding IclR family transcriptional regulator